MSTPEDPQAEKEDKKKLPPNNEAKRQDVKTAKKPNESNEQLQNKINLFAEEINYQENIIAQAYDQLDTMQNTIGVLKQNIKRSLNNSPLKRPRMVQQKQNPESK